MRLSCNGCRVLRKGCGDSCSIRGCLGWIKSPDAQANATVFLAKFYGRAGLLNLIGAGAEAARPAIFRSLLYEACGRIVNPVYGSVGLLWSGRWHMCQAAVDAVLKGEPMPVVGDHLQLQGDDDDDDVAAAAPTHLLLLHHHQKKKQPQPRAASSSSSDGNDGHGDAALPSDSEAPLLHKVAKPGRPRFKRAHKQQHPIPMGIVDDLKDHSSSTEEAGSHVSQAATEQQHGFQFQEEQQQPPGLDLTLAFAPLPAPSCVAEPPAFVCLRFL